MFENGTLLVRSCNRVGSDGSFSKIHVKNVSDNLLYGLGGHSTLEVTGVGLLGQQFKTRGLLVRGFLQKKMVIH